MPLSAQPLHPHFAAELSGIDLRHEIDPETIGEINAALERFAVCVVRHDTPLSNQQHIAFSALLGPIEGRSTDKMAGTGLRIPHGEIIDQGNLDQDGNIYPDDDRRIMFKRANRLWHTDMSFYRNRATYSLLSAHMVPPSGADTQFADTRAVYDALPERTKSRIDGLMAEHSYWHSRKQGGAPEPTEEERGSRPPVRHPLVHVHGGSARKALYIASHASHIVGWPVEDGRALLDELMEIATQQQFVYSHKWRIGDVLIWDNLCTIHRATPFDDTTHRRDMRRTTCRESAEAI